MLDLNTLTAEERRDFFFEPCKTREELRQHMRIFLKVDFPDVIVDEESTSTPFNFVWQVYNTMLTGKGPTRHVVAASRGSSKTLSACVIRFYGMTVFRRNGTHLAANLQQSKAATDYLSKFLKIPEVQPYVAVNNQREIMLKGLPPNSYTARDEAKLQVAVATMAGVNSQRGSLNTRDELDLVPATILAEAAFINDPTLDEHRFPPVSLSLSSRKTNSGPIQKLLDEAEKGLSDRLCAHKWSTVDWMKRCHPSIYKPELGKKQAWINVENLKVTWPEQYAALSPAELPMQREVQAYEGCRTCPAFVVCQGRSVKQTGTQRTLRDIEFVGDLIEDVGAADKIIAQALNWRPENSATIFRSFTRHRHLLGYIKAYKWAFGEYFNPTPDDISPDMLKEMLANPDLDAELLRSITPTKSDLYARFIERGWRCHYGIDWGFSPDPACIVVIMFDLKTKRAFLLHTDAANEYANGNWVDHIGQNIWPLYPCDLACPDKDKGSPGYFRKYRIPNIETKPARVESGVSQLRGLLWDVQEQREKFVILDDGEFGKNRWVAECFEKWTHPKNQMGFDFTKFDGNSPYTHPIDASRYALDYFLDTQSIKLAVAQVKTDEQVQVAAYKGDEAAQQALRDKAAGATGRSLLQEHFASEFGLANVFSEADKLNEARTPKPTPKPGEEKKTGIKFRF